MTPRSTFQGGRQTPLSSTPPRDLHTSRLLRVVRALVGKGRQWTRDVLARLGYLLLAGALVYAVVDLQSDRLVALYALPAAALPGVSLTTVDLGEPIRSGERLAVLYTLAGVFLPCCYHLWAGVAGVLGAPARLECTRRLLWWALSGPLHLYVATALVWPWVAEAVALLALESLPGDLAVGGTMGGVRLSNAVDLALATLWGTVVARALPGALFWLGYAGGWTPLLLRRTRRLGILMVLVLGYGLVPTGLCHRVTAWTMLLVGFEVVWYHWSLAGPRQAYWVERLLGIPSRVWSPAHTRHSSPRHCPPPREV
jgi:hypothetical protein